MSLYKEEILDHFRFPRHKGRLINPDILSGDYNPSCGDSVSFEIKLTNSHIGQIAFEGAGCVISQATASMLSESVMGKTIDYAAGLQPEDIFKLIGLELGPTRSKCALLSLMALQQGIRMYLSKQSNVK